jgi:hypothetical protein
MQNSNINSNLDIKCGIGRQAILVEPGPTSGVHLADATDLKHGKNALDASLNKDRQPLIAY